MECESHLIAYTNLLSSLQVSVNITDKRACGFSGTSPKIGIKCLDVPRLLPDSFLFPFFYSSHIFYNTNLLDIHLNMGGS